MKKWDWLYPIWSIIVLWVGYDILSIAYDPQYSEIQLTSGQAAWLSVLMPLYFVLWFGCIFAGHWVISKLLKGVKK